MLGLGCNYNRFGARVYNVTMGDNCAYNTIGRNSGTLSFAGSFSYSTIGDNVTNSTFGSGTQNLTVGNSCQYLQVGANCRHVEIYNCSGTATVPFAIPPNTTNAIYRNNALVVAGGGGGGADTVLKTALPLTFTGDAHYSAVSGTITTDLTGAKRGATLRVIINSTLTLPTNCNIISGTFLANRNNVVFFHFIDAGQIDVSIVQQT